MPGPYSDYRIILIVVATNYQVNNPLDFEVKTGRANRKSKPSPVLLGRAAYLRLKTKQRYE